MATTTHPNLPLALAANPNVVCFAAVDGTAMIFTKNDGEQDVRGQLDDIYSKTDLEFSDVLLSFEVDFDIGEDYDALFVYE